MRPPRSHVAAFSAALATLGGSLLGWTFVSSSRLDVPTKTAPGAPATAQASPRDSPGSDSVRRSAGFRATGRKIPTTTPLELAATSGDRAPSTISRLEPTARDAGESDRTPSSATAFSAPDGSSESADPLRQAATDADDHEPISPDHREMIASLRAGEPTRRTADPMEVGPPPAICFAPGTDVGLMNAMTRASWEGFVRDFGDEAFALQAFQLGSRWTTSALTPTTVSSRLGQGDPVTLTWGFLPDGVNIPGGANGSGEPASPSDLLAWLNANFGHDPASSDPRDQPWFALFEQVFARWSEVTGIRYVYEGNDDGASFPGSRGADGTRADVRIGGHPMDGFGNTLAYNFFPNGGDMVLDTVDSYLTVATNNYRRLRNIVAHEHGHGIGLQHVCPLDQTKLMEGRLSLGFDGPQFDDVYSANRHYGDALEDTDGDGQSEDNDAPSRAAPLGTLGYGIHTFPNLSIDDNSDIDFLSFQLPDADARITITATPQGSTYEEGPQSSTGSCDTSSLFNFLTVHDLDVQLLAADGSTVLASAQTGGPGEPESLTDFEPGEPGPFFIRIAGGSANETQLYSLAVSVEPSVIPTLVVEDAEAPENAEAVVFTARLSPAPVVAASVGYETASGTGVEGIDFSAVAGTLVFEAGETEKRVSVPLLPDTRDESDETFLLLLADPELLAPAAPFATGRILDDDPAPSISVSGTSVPESANGVALSVLLSAPSDLIVTVDHAPVDETAVRGFDYNTNPGTLTFNPGQTSRTIGALIINDALDENDESFRFEFSNPSNATLGVIDATVIIVDNDPEPTLSIAPASAGEADAVIVFQLVLSSPSGRTATFEWSTLGDSATADVDFDSASGMVEFNPGDTSAEILVPLIQDTLPEIDETILVMISTPIHIAISAASSSGRILDDDALPAARRSLMLDPPAQSGSGGPTIRFDAVPGRLYLVEGTDNLVDWIPLPGADPVLADDPQVLVEDPTSPAEDRRFYRLLDGGTPPEP